MDNQHQKTRNENRVNPNDTSRVEKGKSSVLTPPEALGLEKFPPAAHELESILQFETSYELVEWLAHRL